ncbi:iron-containing redox enzyme family protein [Myxococcus stipitatus]|uniref:iron-containing redox enzyme family protein n=1 Tax=Myxococcus stipitatus TaxID=83455 RepID=UPI003144DC21
MRPQTKDVSRTDWVVALEREVAVLEEALDSSPLARNLFEGRIDSEGYARFLAQTYHYVRWTTPLLEIAGTRMRQSGLHPALAELLVSKSAEERGHERWLLADLRNLGWPAERVETTPPCGAVKAYVAWNQYTTQEGVPTAFLGTAYVLESLAVRRAGSTVDRLVSAARIPNIQKAVTFLRGHSDVDGDHVGALTEVLRTLDDPEEQEVLIHSARTTRLLYPGLFLEK